MKTIKKYLEIFIFSWIVFIDASRNMGFWGNIRNGRFHLGLGVIVFTFIILQYGIGRLNKYFVIGYSLICLLWPCFRVQLAQLLYLDLGPFIALGLNIWLGGIVVSIIAGHPKSCMNYLLVWYKESSRLTKLQVGLFAAFFLVASISRYQKDLPLYTLFVIGLLLLWPVKDKMEDILSNMSTGIIFGFWVLQGLALLTRPFYTQTYLGMYDLSSEYSRLCVVTLIFSLYKIYETKTKAKRVFMWMYVVNAFAVFSYLLLSMSRITLLVVFCCGIGFLVYYHRRIKRFTVRKLICLFGFGIVGISISFVLTFEMVRYIPAIVHHPLYLYDEYNDENVILPEDGIDSEKYRSLEQSVSKFFERFTRLWKDNNAVEAVDDSPLESTANSVETPAEGQVVSETQPKYYLKEDYNGFELRLGIWMTYLSRLNLRGHSEAEQTLNILPNETVAHAHNVFVQMLYSYGIPGGILFIAWIIAYGANCIKSHRNDRVIGGVVLYSFLIIMGIGMAESMWQISQITWTVLLILQKFALEQADKNTLKEI